MKMKFTGYLLFSIILIVCTIIAYQNVRDRLHYRRVVMTLHTADRIEVGQPIHYLGVRVGEVQEVTARDSSVVIVAKLDKGFQILQGTGMRVAKIGLFGEGMVELLPPSGDGERVFYQPGDTVRIYGPREQKSRTDVVGAIAGIAASVGLISKQDEIITRLDTLNALLREHIRLHATEAASTPAEAPINR